MKIELEVTPEMVKFAKNCTDGYIVSNQLKEAIQKTNYLMLKLKTPPIKRFLIIENSSHLELIPVMKKINEIIDYLELIEKRKEQGHGS